MKVIDLEQIRETALYWARVGNAHETMNAMQLYLLLEILNTLDRIESAIEISQDVRETP